MSEGRETQEPFGAEDHFELSKPENLPTIPKGATEDLRARIRKKALGDFYFFLKVVLGYTDLNPRTHRALCTYMQKATYPRRMVLMPRNTFKTTICTIGHTVWLIANDPDITVLLIADTEKNASRFLEEIKQHFEHNAFFRWVFPEIIPPNFTKARWSSTEIQVPRKSVQREPTVDAIGALGGVESRHYKYIKADDLITEKAIHSDTEMEKRIEWSNGLESLLQDIGDNIDFVGSRKKTGDLYAHIERSYGGDDPEQGIGPFAYVRGEISIFCRHILEEGKSIFPERIPTYYLRRLRRVDPHRYYSQYANSPRGTGLNVFHPSWLRKFRRAETGLIECWHDGDLLHTVSPWSMDRMILFDPSVAEKKRNSMQAILVVAKGSHPFRFVLDTKIGHFPIDQAIDELLALYLKWKPGIVSVEKRGFQGSIKYWMMEKTERENIPYPPLIEWPPEGSHKAQWAKTEHIRALQPMVRSNLLWLPEEADELIEQFESYPNVSHDDGLDALTQALDYWPALMDEEEVRANKQKEVDYLSTSGIGGILVDSSNSWDEQKFLASLSASGYGVRRAEA